MVSKNHAIAIALLLIATVPVAVVSNAPLVVAQHGAAPPASPTDTPEQKMLRRFPQPVRVGDLIGQRVLDDDDSTLGHVRQVVRTPDGKIKLIVSYGGWFGWGSRLVAVPIEVVASLARQIAAVDMPPSEFAAAPTWSGTGAQVLPNDEMIRIALGRR